jgi:serine/threonine-protein kinase SRPK3
MSLPVNSLSEGEIPDDESSVVFDSDEESTKDYRPGGYHPVQLHEMFLNRYIVVQKLGWGHFSTVWLCKDTKYNTYVAMKVQKSAPNYTEAAYDEIDILLKVSNSYKDSLWLESCVNYFDKDEAEKIRSEPTREHCFVVQLLNSFMHQGPNGKHVCMVFEILGVNLLEIIKRYNYKGVRDI